MELILNHMREHESEGERFTPKEDGAFLMNFSSFLDVFNNMFVTIDFNDNWTGVRCKSQWD